MELPPPPTNISGSETWKNTANFRFFGSYSNGGDVDAAVKDILFNKLPLSSRGYYQPIFGSFVCDSAYSAIIQTYTSRGTYASMIVFGYASDHLRYYQLRNGTLYRQYIGTTKEIVQ